ncbi:MAG: TRAP transporter small permease [Deltaproteobacteria bacterium]|nr:MAG: TRAP transporter small permease [Deltaproteobacteria bacterium]
MKYLDQIQKGVAFVAWVFLMVTISAIVGLFLLTLADILAIAIGFSFQGAVEIGEYLLVAIIFLGLGYAQLKETHIRVEILVSRLHPTSQTSIEVFILTVTSFFFTLMAVQIGQEAYKAWIEKIYHTGWADLAIPTWPPILVALMGCIVLILSLLIQLIRNVINLINRDPGSTKETA